MKFICDFHVHSHFSRATSKQLVPEYLDYWARVKGIKVVGTGDFTHPEWVSELKEKLEFAEPGLFKLKKKYKNTIPALCPEKFDDIRFLLSAEISNIYKKGGTVRKIHSLILAPGFEAVEKVQHKLAQRGANIVSDGRPILGMDVKDLLSLFLDVSGDFVFIPAHIWTPWFSVLGSKSGFNSVRECFEELSDYICAVETGLSTDPSMHWLCSFLDEYTLISNSDAHSPEKLGRNANIFNTELTYGAIVNALKNTGQNRNAFVGTIDLFPQEGKYYYDGHRKCRVCLNPKDTILNNGVCPVCGSNVTIGVKNRVLQLADREDGLKRNNKKPFYSIIPLKEILSEISGTLPASKKVNKLYWEIIKKTGSELELLLEMSISEIEKNSNEVLAEAVQRMRNKKVFLNPGFDGEYGRITLFKTAENQKNSPIH
ncbi:MAG: endonuclease Q family protein [Candidatus Omnitrophota bacterium]